jgi:Signal transduction histidine kinase
MTFDDFTRRVHGWFTRENFAANRLAFEGVAAGVWFVIALPSAAGFGGALGVVGHLLLASTLVLYRVQPIVGLIAGALGTLVLMTTGLGFYIGSFLLYLPLLAVFFGAAAYGHSVTRWLALVGTPIAAGGVVSSSFWNIQAFIGAILFWFALAVLVLAWVGGMLVYVNRGRRAALTGEIRATAQLGAAKQEVTLEQERNRVARDVHDIVAHSLAVVIAQADGARYSAKSIPAPVVEALENISATARGALTDVRVLLGELRHNQEAGPQPGMDDLDGLVRGFRESGLDIEWHSYGSAAELSDASALAVYRIVQEALTNALRHGDRTKPVDLVFDWGTSSLAVIITNALIEGDAAPAKSGGHGIPGMRERAALAGGELEASDGTNGRFRVRATIPFTRETVEA